MIETAIRAKYALVNEYNGTVILAIGQADDVGLVAEGAYAIADQERPGWREEGLKLWLRVGQQA